VRLQLPPLCSSRKGRAFLASSIVFCSIPFNDEYAVSWHLDLQERDTDCMLIGVFCVLDNGDPLSKTLFAELPLSVPLAAQPRLPNRRSIAHEPFLEPSEFSEWRDRWDSSLLDFAILQVGFFL